MTHACRKTIIRDPLRQSFREEEMHSKDDGAATLVYKVCLRSEWDHAVAGGRYLGSADDVRDGYIHLSTRVQLPGTLAKYFRGKKGLVMITFAAEELGQHLRWEPSRGDQLFPHFYGPLPTGRARSVVPLKLGADQIPVLPQELSS